mmetsp:Transcript_22047/g.43353  ORF Transcript_22047/g.43353 Transcript_22047/m.43353 type:complete len:919 (+) Transcript_22047:120-2876(+)
MDPVVARFQRDLNCLSEDDRTTRTNALKRLNEAAFGRRTADELEVDGARDTLLQHGLLQALAGRISDPAEKCRELSIAMLTQFILDDATSRTSSSPAKGHALSPATVDSLASVAIESMQPRLCEIPFPESSEEIRLALIELLSVLLDHTSAHKALERNFAGVCKVLTKASTDTFPDSKKVCALCVVKVCTGFGDIAHREFETMLDAMASNLMHQHAKVRQASLEAIKALVVACAGKSANIEEVMREKVVPAIRNVNHDRASAVRIRGIELISELLRTMANSGTYMKDLLPILIFGLADQAKQIQDMTLEVIEKLGQTLVPEPTANETSDAPGEISTMLPEPFTKRPGAGARQLVVNILPSALPKLLQEARDWTAQERFRAVALLRCFIIFAEDAIEAYLRDVCETLYIASMDDEQTVRDTATDSARLLGQYCDTKKLLDLMLPACLGHKAPLANDANNGNVSVPEETSSRRLGALACLAGATAGLQTQSQINEHLARIALTLNNPSLEQAASTESAIQAHVLQALSSLLERAYGLQAEGKLDSLSLETTCNILRALFILLTSPGDEDLANGAEESLVLAAACGGFFQQVVMEDSGEQEAVPSVSTMVEACSSKLLPVDTTKCESWSKYTADRRVFDQTVRRAGVAGLDRQSQLKKAVQVLVVTTPADRDADLRLCMLSLLESMIGSYDDAQQHMECDKENRGPLDAFAPTLVDKVLVPNLVWRAGRVPSTIRKISMYCLSRLAAVTSASQAQWFSQELEKIFPTLKACLDDLETDTRRFTCMALRDIYGLLGAHGMTLERMVVMDGYHDIIKRLDDADDRVRIVACEALVNMIQISPTDVLKGTAAEYIVDTAYIHMDDAQATVQTSVYSVVEALIRRGVDVGKIASKAGDHRARHRSPELCDRVIALCQEMDSSASA